jgi:predicted hydrocarbon binding protein
MKVTEFNFTDHLSLNPKTGIAKFGDQRIVIMNAISVGRMILNMIDIGGINMAKIMTRRFWETAGREDAKQLKQEFNPDGDMDWIALGPTIHTWQGIVKAVPTALDFDRNTGKFFMQGDWENSFFAEQYLKAYGKSKEPVCWMLSGYATGYGSEFFGKPVICRETKCVAMGDDSCQFTIKPSAEWEE